MKPVFSGIRTTSTRTDPVSITKSNIKTTTVSGSQSTYVIKRPVFSYCLYHPTCPVADPHLPGTLKTMWEQMGKVQDTFSRIRTRSGQAGSGNSAPISLLVPTQRAPAASSFPTRPDAVVEWFNALPATRSAATVHHLTRALQHSNRLHNTPSQRLLATHLFAARVQQALPLLDARYLTMDLPLSQDGQQAFDQATLLLQELSFSYKIILLDFLQRRGKLTRKQRVPVIYQAIRCIGECMLRHAQLYRDWPEKSWRDLNTLFILAERDQGLDVGIPEPATSTAPVQQTLLKTTAAGTTDTIRQRYSQLCAFAICNTGQLTAGQIDQLYRSLALHSPRYKLTSERPVGSADNLYSMTLNNANPPSSHQFSLHDDSQDLRYFSTESLVNTDLLTNPETASSGERLLNLERQALLWKNATTRNSARSIRHTTLYAETGIKEIYSSISLTQTDSGPTTLGYSNSADTESTAPACQPMNSAEWLSYQPATELGSVWTMKNHSQSGMCLLWTGQGSCRLMIGGLLGHCMMHKPSGQLRWLVGIVRWIAQGKEGLSCGVEFISSDATAVTLQTIIHKLPQPAQGGIHQIDNPSAEGLVLKNNDSDRRLLLLATDKPYKIGQTLRLQENGTTSVTRLAQKINYSKGVQCFALQELTTETPLAKPQHANC